LGVAVLRWRRNQESSEILSDSQPERLEFGSDSLLSVNTQNDLADGAIETSSQTTQRRKNHGRGTATRDRCLDRRSNLATRSKEERNRSSETIDDGGRL
jgi:hypothetical protein